MDVADDAVPLRGRHHGADAGGLVGGVPDVVLGHRRSGQFQRLLVVGLGHQHPAQRVAALAAVGEAPGDPELDRFHQVGVVQDDVRRLAAELQRHAFDRLRGHFRDATDGAVLQQHHAVRVHDPRDQVGAHQHAIVGDRDRDSVARAHPAVGEDAGEELRGERGDLAGLQHHGAPRGQGGDHFGHHLVQRVVPGRDGRHHPHRFPHHERVADLFAPGETGFEHLDDPR